VKQSKSQQIVANAYAGASTTEFEPRHWLPFQSSSAIAALRSARGSGFGMKPADLD